MANSNLCAGEGIIGPISDVQHVSKEENDAEGELDTFDEDAEFDPANWGEDTDWESTGDWQDFEEEER